jgi:hypothetical protein
MDVRSSTTTSVARLTFAERWLWLLWVSVTCACGVCDVAVMDLLNICQAILIGTRIVRGSVHSLPKEIS